MKALTALVRRNTKVFFKDKGMFFTSLVTPMILLVLYATFLADLYRDSFASSLPQGVPISDKLIDGMVGGQLVSSLLSVCCVTVAFCSNMLSVTDKVTGVRADLTVTPVRREILAFSYYLSTLASTLLIAFATFFVGILYLLAVGFYLSVADILLIALDILLLVMFGTALSSIIHFFLSTQGQISAVGTIISAGYGFICGAYMPISQFASGVQTAVAFLPGTYATSLFRNHCLRGVFAEMKELGIPSTAIESMRDAVDCNVYFFGERVEEWTCFLILGGGVLLLMAVYLCMNFFGRRRK